jgi:hypothetical protein
MMANRAPKKPPTIKRNTYSVSLPLPRENTTEVCIRVAGEATGGAFQSDADRETDDNVR